MSTGMENDYFKEVITEYCEEELYSNDKLDNIVPSDDFKKKMSDIVQMADKKHCPKRKYRVRWAAAAMLAVIAGTTLLIGLNGDVKAGCLKIVKKVMDGGFDGYSIVDNESEVYDDSITGFKPGYIPEGYKCVLNDENSRMSNMYKYVKGGNELVFVCNNSECSEVLTNNEVTEHKIIELEDGTKAHYYVDNGSNGYNSLIWKIDGYICILQYSIIDEKEMIRIAGEVEAVYE